MAVDTRANRLCLLNTVEYHHRHMQEVSMHPRFLLSTVIAAALCTAALSAQNTPSSQEVTIGPTNNANCLVHFSARRWNDASALTDVDSWRKETRERGLVLRQERGNFGNEVSSATVVVHGSALSLHLESVHSFVTADLQQTFQLADLARDRDGSWKLTTDRVPLIRQIEIIELRFVDGTLWHKSQEAHCSFVPDSYLTVTKG